MIRIPAALADAMNRSTRTAVSFSLALLICAALLAACGGTKRVRGEAPFVDITSWSIDGQELSAALRVRNVNDEALPVSGIQLDIDLDGESLVSHLETTDIEVAANGSERVDLVMTATEAGTALLSELQGGERQSLPYHFEGWVQETDGKKMRYQRDGHIYTVPGRPGQFR